MTYSASALYSTRFLMGAAVVGNKAYFGGGAFSTIVDVYDYSTGYWSTLTTGLSVGRADIGTVSVGFKIIFFCGAGDGYSLSNVVDIYDTISGTLSTSTSANPRRLLAFAAVDSVYAIFAGGLDSAISNFVSIYNYTSGTWSSSSISQARMSAVGLGYKSNFYCAGGFDLIQNGNNTTDILNTNTFTWSTATLSVARGVIVAVNVGPILLFAGGYSSGSSVVSTVDIFESNLKIWSTTSMSTPRWYFAGASLGCKAFFGGGYINVGGTATSSVEVYDASLKTWNTISGMEATSTSLSAVQIGSIVLFAGGNNNRATYYSYSCTIIGITFIFTIYHFRRFIKKWLVLLFIRVL